MESLGAEEKRSRGGNSLISLGLMRHADSAPSVYGNSILWLGGFAKQKIMKYRSFIGGNLLSHSIELPYTEGAESVCLISRRDNTSAPPNQASPNLFPQHPACAYRIGCKKCHNPLGPFLWHSIDPAL